MYMQLPEVFFKLLPYYRFGVVKIRVVEDLTRGELGDTGCTKTTTTTNNVILAKSRQA